jgi:serine/threonine-protein kinase
MIRQTLGHYKILEKLGEGGMGEVYRAEDSTLKRQVALKVLPPDLAASQERLERFQREAESLAALNHPNIVMIHTVEEAEGTRFLTMELVEGKQLSTLIPKGGMPLERIFEIAVPLADALAAAHDRGVIHRDLKPANIMVTEEGRVKVLDFGLAKLRREHLAETATELPTEPLTEEGRVLGTMPYMSPEQVEGKDVDSRSDIFSLGVILYELATGERPFKGETSASLISAIMRDTPPDADTLRDGLPHHLGRIIRRCLEKDPDRRYQRAHDPRHELDDLKAETSSVADQAIGRPAQATQAPSRKMITIGALAALALVAALVGLLLDRHRQGPVSSTEPEPIRSIAVLPLSNLMNDPEQDYFVDGMTESLIASLARIGALRVISRTSTMQYKGADMPLPEIARELGVDALIEGSVLRAGDQVRITAQLVDGGTDEHLWVETYDRDVENVLAVHSEVAKAVAEEIQIALTEEEAARLAVTPAINSAAQDAYLKGQYFLHRLDVDKGFEYFELALEEDPNFALPRAGRAGAFLGAVVVGSGPPRVLYPEAEKAALKALELDDTLAEAHQFLGWVRLWSDWDWPAAERHFQQAIDLNPSESWARWGYSNYLLVVGKLDEAMIEAERARQLDPLSPIMQYGVVWHLYLARRYDEVVEQGQKVLRMFPDHEFVHALVMSAYIEQGLFSEAFQHLDKTGGVYADSELREAFDRGYRESGFQGAWSAAAEVLVAQSELRYINASDIALAYSRAQDREQMLYWLEKLVEEREPLAVYLALQPDWDDVRDDPRFQAMLAKHEKRTN